jgi:hypothetical protein
MASIRASKLAKYLIDHGLDVRVLTADATDEDKSLLRRTARRDHPTPWNRSGHQIESLRALIGGRRAPGVASTPPRPANETPARSLAPKSALRAALRNAYRDIVDWPDSRAGWRRHALEAGMNIMKTWRPDVIYATAPPATTLIGIGAVALANVPGWLNASVDDNPITNTRACA